MSNDYDKQPGDEALSERYRSLPDEQPPAELDAAILAAAHRQAARSGGTGRSHKRHWYLPLSAAAVVLISVSVVVKLVVDERALQPNDEMALPVPQKQLQSLEMEHRELPRPAAAMAPKSVPRAPDAAMPLQDAEDVSAAGGSFTTNSVQSEPALSTAAEEAKKAELTRESVSSSARFMRIAPTANFADSKVAGNEGSERLQQWLDKLQKLLDAGDDEALKTQLSAFRREYPEYSLPASLAQWENKNRPGKSD